MRLSKAMREKLEFAEFCVRHADKGFFPRDAAELVTLAHRAFRMGEAHCNHDGYADKCDKARRAFEGQAQAMGFGVEWPGLWPRLTKDGCDEHLPL